MAWQTLAGCVIFFAMREATMGHAATTAATQMFERGGSAFFPVRVQGCGVSPKKSVQE